MEVNITGMSSLNSNNQLHGHGLAQMIVAEAEALAKSQGFLMINLDVRATQERALQSFEARGFSRYATNAFYAKVDDAFVTGFYYQKEL